MSKYQDFKLELIEVLDNFGFCELIEDTQTDLCGSTYSIYGNGHNRYILQWDGEEGIGSVERWQNSKWTAFKTSVPDSSELVFNEALKKLSKKLKKHIKKHSITDSNVE